VTAPMSPHPMQRSAAACKYCTRPG
jgi:hypothetical protein